MPSHVLADDRCGAPLRIRAVTNRREPNYEVHHIQTTSN